jgi:hypothetical protein
MKAHILGNGPSIELYQPTDGLIIGCNIQEHPVDVSVVLDKRPFLKYCGNRSLFQGKPIITSEYAMPTLIEQEITHEFDIWHKVAYLEKYMSAGHVAAHWLIDHDYTEIHLWGFDSIWADTIETKTDKIIERSRAQFDLYIHWRERWQKYKGFGIIVHNTKEGTPLEELL